MARGRSLPNGARVMKIVETVLDSARPLSDGGQPGQPAVRRRPKTKVGAAQLAPALTVAGLGQNRSDTFTGSVGST